MPTRWGQNFLADPAWIARVAGAVGPAEGEPIIEIGGGLGGVSALLAARGCRLTIVEIDPRLAAGLRSRFAGLETVRVIAADVLALDWAELASGSADSQPRLFGNLPYYITGPILLRFFRQVELFRGGVFMVQREIAERLTATSGPEYGGLSAAAQFFCQPTRLFDVPPGAFRPQPQVWSSLVEMAPAEAASSPGEERERFLDFLRLAFGQKRKLLANNLKARHAPSHLAAAMAAAGIPAGARAEECPPRRLWRLFRALDTFQP